MFLLVTSVRSRSDWWCCLLHCELGALEDRILLSKVGKVGSLRQPLHVSVIATNFRSLDKSPGICTTQLVHSILVDRD